MPRRKQDCPKKMKNGDGDGEEDDKKNVDDNDLKNESERKDDDTDDENNDQRGSRSRSRSKSRSQTPLLSPVKKETVMEPDVDIEEDSDESDDHRSLKQSPVQDDHHTISNSIDSNSLSYPTNDCNLMYPVVPSISPLGISIPPTLTGNAATTLLPPNNAAMAAYLAAAVAAHQSLSFHSRAASISPLVTTPSSLSPSSLINNIPTSSSGGDVLDFSTKKSSSVSPVDENNPLDLSRKKRKFPEKDDVLLPTVKKSKNADKLPIWPTPSLPYFPAVSSSAIMPLPQSPQLPSDWNGKTKLHHSSPISEASKALEKMSELTKLSSANNTEDYFRPQQPLISPATGRHSAWQSHWLNKGADQAKDVLKCVWCKQSFPSLAALTTHMKEAKHCGVNAPSSLSSTLTHNNHSNHHHHHHHNHHSTTSGYHHSHHAVKNESLNLLIKETMPLPRKLVRGQDVWLGKGAEQTRQILKCMWCGQSFRSLAEMTSHMQQTQHYTNIISQEQIISWKSHDDKHSSSTSTSNVTTPTTTSPTTINSVSNSVSNSNSHVSAVLTCKVCDQAFSSLKELSNHMVKNAHYKEHIMRSISDSGGRRRQAREKRKKSLPVRKLLELERAQNGDLNFFKLAASAAASSSAGKITCEKCGDKIDTLMFVEHIRQCIGANAIIGQKSFKKKPDLQFENNTKSSNSPLSATDLSTKDSSAITNLNHSSTTTTTTTTNSSPSVLNAIEKLIEKSFDSKNGHKSSSTSSSLSLQNNNNNNNNNSILRKLGIDESVDYTKPLVDTHTMSLLKSYQHLKRERSGSESSSIAESNGSEKKDFLKMETESVDEDNNNRIEPTLKSNEQEIEQSSSPPVQSPIPAISPASNISSHSDRSSSEKRSSLVALSSMFDNLTGSISEPTTSNDSKRNSNHHPLAALQKLCDKTEKTHHSTKTSSSTTSTTNTIWPSIPSPSASNSNNTNNNNDVLDATIIKCAFCESPFISKGAYRHHLAKMHFIKDPALMDQHQQQLLKATSSLNTILAATSPKQEMKPSTHAVPIAATTAPQSSSSSSASSTSSFDESPHSKFLKYSELAKQLSSKYV